MTPQSGVPAEDCGAAAAAESSTGTWSKRSSPPEYLASISPAGLEAAQFFAAGRLQLSLAGCQQTAWLQIPGRRMLRPQTTSGNSAHSDAIGAILNVRTRSEGFLAGMHTAPIAWPESKRMAALESPSAMSGPAGRAPLGLERTQTNGIPIAHQLWTYCKAGRSCSHSQH